MSAPKSKQNYLNNPNLPTADAVHEYTPEMVSEIKKCQTSILHFAENYFHIVSLDEGKQTISLHPCQKRALRKMRDNRFFILLASRQIGKALALDTKIKTTKGWSTMGQLKTGDQVYGTNGKACNVVYAHDTLHNRDCYRVTFDKGEQIVADADHRWFTEAKNERKKGGSIKTTKELLNTLYAGKELNHRIPSSITGIEGEIAEFRSQWHYIKNIEKVESVPVRCITVDSSDHLFLVGEQFIPTSNTTLMTIYALWIACFMTDQSILIVANKEDTAIEIFRRIRLAYEELPNWVKPGIKGSYGKTSMELANGTMIGISTTTGTAARGKSINVLILDELAFIEQHLVNEFWKSVYPIVSSSKKSKIFIASTANGTGNLFHTLYSGAESGKNGWECDKILWNEIPGRNELWKLQTIATIGSREAFDQEFGCEFLDSGDSTIDEEIYEKLSVSIRQPKYTMDGGSYQIWDEPKDDRIYVAGVDVSEGVGKDSSVINILDMTDLTAIKQVACWANNQIPPQKFTTVVHEVLVQWGKPLVCIERNNCGGQVVDNLRSIYSYENIVSWGASAAGRLKDQLGIVAHTNTKYTGITNMRYWVNQLQAVQIRDIKLLKELKNFIRSANGTWAAKKGTNYHDDLVMSLVWCLIILEQNIVQKYFEVLEFDANHKPLIIKQMDFGIKYFTNPGSIYNDDGEYATAMPSIIGNNMRVDDEMSALQQQGYRFLQ